MKTKQTIWLLVATSFLGSLITFLVLSGMQGVNNGNTQDVVATKPAATKPANWFDESRPASFADLASQVSPAVVNISTKKIMKRPQMQPFSPFGGGQRDPFFDHFFDNFFEGGPQQQAPQQSLGSGFIIDKDGTILTNTHVVAGADEIEVQLADERKFKAEVVGEDPRYDVAVIKIKAEADVPFVKLGDSDKMRPGDWVMAIGNPFGLEKTVTVGVVSATGRVVGGGTYGKYIQTDASINPGNSGGPLFNLQGEVIGINSMIFANGQGIGFAIPINMAKQLTPQLVKQGRVTRGWLGVAIQDITPELAQSFGLKDGQGALIADVYAGSPAAKAGLQRGDVVTSFDGQVVKEPYDLTLAVGGTSPGKDVAIVVLRSGQQKTLTIRVGENKEEQNIQAGKASPQAPSSADRLGIVAQSITPDDAAALDVPANFKGVVVARIEPMSIAETAEIAPGDVILEVNGTKIDSLTAYQTAVKNLKPASYIRLLVKRGKASIYLGFQLPK